VVHVMDTSAVSQTAIRPLRLLFFVPVCVYPVSHGGASKFTNTVWGLSERGHEVHVLSLVGDEAEREAMRSLPHVASSDSYVIPPETRYFPGSAVPAAVRGTYRPLMGRRIEEAVRRHAIDILQLDFTHSAAYVSNSVGRPTVLVEIDIAYRSAFRSALKQDGVLKTAYGLFDATRLYHWELRNVRKADLVLASSEHEAMILRRHGIAKVSSDVPNGVDVAACEPRGTRCETRDILFVGHFGHPPNVDALRHFVSRIWPRLRAHGQELSVSVVGPGLPSVLASEVRGCGFRHAGYVKDLRTELWSHRVFIAPIRLGAGTRIKLLEAAAAKCAMVSTTLGAEGLGLRDGQDLLIADCPADFARSVERLLGDSALRARLGVSAHDSVKRRFDSPTLAANLEGLYYRLLEQS
jgi:glycosyltransferase involved in cell wall biosynthesis